MKSECRGVVYQISFLCFLLSAAIFLAGCTNPEKAKADHVAKGEAYLKDSKFQEASLEFRNAIQIDDNYAAAHWGLARAFEGLERYPEMLTELQKTITKDGNNLDARLKLGNYYLAGYRGRPEILAEADRLAKEVLAKDPKNIEGHILMGSVLFHQNQKDKAFEELNTAVNIDPNRVESYLSLARFLVVNKEPAKAEELFKKAISVNYNSPLAHSEYGKFLAQSNRQPEAEAELRRAVEVGPKDRDARFILASYYFVTRQVDKAEEQYKAMVGLDPNKPENHVILADFYVAMNRPDDAVQTLQNLLSKSPDYVQGRYRLGEILLGKGDTQGASAQIEELLKKDQHDRQALVLRARLRAQSGQPDGLKSAIADLNEVLQQEPNSQPALYFLAQYNLNLGLLDQARSFGAELEKNYPDYLPGKFMQLQLALAGGDYKGAITQATDLLARVETSAPARGNSSQLIKEIHEKAFLSRGAAQLQSRNNEAARKDFEAARNVNPNDPLVYNSLAMISIAENKKDDAINFFDTALKVDGTNYDALNGLITLYARNNEPDKGHARIDQALASFPNNASLHFLKAQAFGFQRNTASAEAELRKALEIDSNYVSAYYALAAIYVNTRQEDRAIAEYQKFIALRPDNAVPYTLIGIIEDMRKNFDAAADNYKKALEKDPNSVIAANNLAWLYAVTGKGNLDEAVRLAQGVVQKAPNQAGYIDTLGWVYYKKNLHGAAVEQLRKAVSLNEAQARVANISPSATYHYHLGMALKEAGNREESRKELETAIRLADKSPFADIEEAKKALASL